MQTQLLGHLKNGAPVYDRIKSHIHTEYEKVFEYTKQVLSHIEPPHENYFHYSHDFGRVIGESIRVPTKAGDDIMYAKRLNRAGHTRFVKNKPLRPTSVFTVVLKRDRRSKDEQYILITAYVGEKAPEEPWDTMVTPDSLPFWSSNALIWGSVPIVAGTETSECPW